MPIGAKSVMVDDPGLLPGRVTPDRARELIDSGLAELVKADIKIRRIRMLHAAVVISTQLTHEFSLERSPDLVTAASRWGGPSQDAKNKCRIGRVLKNFSPRDIDIDEISGLFDRGFGHFGKDVTLSEGDPLFGIEIPGIVGTLELDYEEKSAIRLRGCGLAELRESRRMAA